MVNRISWVLLRKYELRVRVGRHSHNLLTTLRRFQLVFIEEYFVNVLKRRRRVAEAPRVALDVSPLVRPPSKRSFPRFGLGLGRLYKFLGEEFYKVRRRIQLHFILKAKRVVPGARVRRLYFIDAEEFKRSHIGQAPYVYHKYMEGLVDVHSLQVDAETLVVLYGVLDHVDNARLRHPRVALLAAHLDPKRKAHVGDLISDALWDAAFESGGIAPSLSPLLSKGKQYFEYLLRTDLELICATDNFLAHFRENLEIYLDTFDAVLFPLSQFLLENHPQHTIVGVQRVLGPYTFSFNIRNNDGLVRQPHRIVTWGPFHARRLRALGYTCELEQRALFRLEAYAPYLTLDRDEIKTRARIPLGIPVVMVSAVQSIINFPLMDRWEYTQMLMELAELANNDRCFIMFKPWPGEDPAGIKEIAAAGFKRNWSMMLSAMGEPFHNVELLRITDIIVSTMSSFIGEALYFGSIPILVDTPAAEAYFSPEYTHRFREICYPPQASLGDTVEEILTLDEVQRKAWRESVLPHFREVFGNAL